MRKESNTHPALTLNGHCTVTDTSTPKKKSKRPRLSTLELIKSLEVKADADLT